MPWVDNKLDLKLGIGGHVDAGVCEKALDRLQHPKPKRLQYDPHLWTVPANGKIIQMAPDPDESDLIDNKGTRRIKYIVGNMLYYAGSVDQTML